MEKDPTGLQSYCFHSRFFLVDKKDRGHRPICNLRELNKFLKVPKVIMVCILSMIEFLAPDSWFAVLDLKNTYFHVAIHPLTGGTYVIGKGQKCFNILHSPLVLLLPVESS